jgi:hypothetical protein
MRASQREIDAVFAGAASQVEQGLAFDVAKMAQDKTVFRSGARFKIIVYPDTFDFDGFSPAIVKGALSLKQITHLQFVPPAVDSFSYRWSTLASVDAVGDCFVGAAI